jgi:hypothetical protein
MIWKTIRHGRAYRFLFPLLLLVSFTAALGQQHEHGSHDMSSEKLGNVSFPTSCSSKVQSEFETGVASLHSFEYDKAMRHFNDVLEHDPNCAIAHWGEAMALYHQL